MSDAHIVLGFVTVLLVLIIALGRWIFDSGKTSSSLELASYASPKTSVSESIIDDITDEQFESVVAKVVPPGQREKAFYVSIVGASHANQDGSSRTTIIQRCHPLDGIDLRAEPENEFDHDAVAVCRHDSGEQIGYLDQRLAGEVTFGRNKHDEQWVAFFRHANHHPTSRRVVGAVIYLIQLADDGESGIEPSIAGKEEA